MATINSTIKMNDKASAVLNKVQQSVGGIAGQASKLNSAYDKTAAKQELINSKISRIDASQKKLATSANYTNNNWIKNVATTIRLQSQLSKLQGQKNKLINQSDQLTREMMDYESQLKKINNLDINPMDGGSGDKWGVVELNQGLELAGKLAQGIKSTLDFSDTLTTNNAKLNLVNDGLQSTEELNDMIYQASLRSRGSYTDMAQSVAKLNMLAGDAFSTNAEAVAFQEMLNKSFTVSGSSESEKSSANYQITQALSSGALQGDELRAIRENAPLVYEAIADYMGKSKGELKELGAEGAITSDVIKNAMFAAGDEINAQFEEMPVTFAQAGTMLQSTWANAMNDVALKLSEAFNSPAAQAALQGLIDAINWFASALSWMFDLIINNWTIVSAILLGLGIILMGVVVPALWAKVAALGVAIIQWMILNWQLVAIAAVIAIVYGVVKALGGGLKTMAIILGLLAVAIAVVKIAIWLMNGALYACPIVWIITLIIALIVIMFMFAEVVGGVIGVAIAIFGNLGKFVANLGVGIGMAIAALCSNIMTAFGNAIKNVKAFFYDLLSTAIEVVIGIVKALNKLPFVDIDFSGLQSSADSWADKAQEERDSKEEYKDIGAEFDKGMSTFEYKDLGEAYEEGAAVGGAIKDSVMGAIDGLMPDTSGMEDEAGSMDDLLNNGAIPTYVEGGSLDEVNISDEDLQFLKDIAARDYQVAYKQVTPNVNISFGDVRETADVDSIKDAVNKMMNEELSELYVMEGA